MQNLSQIGEPAYPQIFDLAPFLRSIALNLFSGNQATANQARETNLCSAVWSEWNIVGPDIGRICWRGYNWAY